jgi:hypothetical protein
LVGKFPAGGTFDGGAPGTSAGGRGASSRKIEPNCAKAGGAARSAANASVKIESFGRTIKIGPENGSQNKSKVAPG